MENLKEQKLDYYNREQYIKEIKEDLKKIEIDLNQTRNQFKGFLTVTKLDNIRFYTLILGK